MKVIKSILLQLFEIFCHILPVSTKKVFFLSFAGQYNDNPKAISLKLHEKAPEIIQYWSISEKSKRNDIPEYLKVVKHNSFYSVYIKNRCKVIVENGAGFYLFYSEKKYVFNFKRHLKNKKQFDLATWHGNPIKHIGAQIPNVGEWSINNTFSSADILLAGSKLVKSIFELAFIDLMPVTLLGTPRTDILFDNSIERKRMLLEKLGLPQNKQIILYAPTYRYSPKDSGIEQLRMIDFNVLLSTLSKKFGGDWIFVMRVHNMVLMTIEESEMLLTYKGKVYDGNRFDDMNEYLFVADVLLTDYSGCIYDVALTDKPCFLFAHDRRNYEQHERGLYTPLNEFPYPFAHSFIELINHITNFSNEDNIFKRQSFLDKIGNVEDGHASERVVALILNQMPS